MKKKSLFPLGESEMEVLQIIWDHGKMSVTDVRKKLLESRDIAYTTVMTTMKNLSVKGYLNYEQLGNSYVYYALKAPHEVKVGVVQSLVEKVFQGSKIDLIASLVKQDEVFDANEVKALEEMLHKLKEGRS